MGSTSDLAFARPGCEGWSNINAAYRLYLVHPCRRRVVGVHLESINIGTGFITPSCTGGSSRFVRVTAAIRDEASAAT